ncbi:putative methyltransferase-domain-containing protein, partial [Baffinella frigidus]
MRHAFPRIALSCLWIASQEVYAFAPASALFSRKAVPAIQRPALLERCPGSFARLGKGGARHLHLAGQGKVDAEILRCFVLRNETAALSILEVEPEDGEGPPDGDARFSKTNRREFRLPGPGGARAVVGEIPFQEGGIGSKVWESSLAMACWMQLNPHRFEGCRIMELGSGTGLGGMLLARGGAGSVTLSDFPGGGAVLIPNLERNVVANSAQDVTGNEPCKVMSLDWTAPPTADSDEGFQLVVGSDLVYDQDIITPLSKTALRLAENGGSIVLVSPSARTGLRELVAALSEGSGRKAKVSLYSIHELQ